MPYVDPMNHTKKYSLNLGLWTSQQNPPILPSRQWSNCTHKLNEEVRGSFQQFSLMQCLYISLFLVKAIGHGHVTLETNNIVS